MRFKRWASLTLADQAPIALHSNVKSSATDTLSLLAILSSVSKDGALTPRSTRLRKSTEMSILSANCS